jgi:peptidoglycan/LPS O-acetylase OafA/YrhL
VADHLGYAEWVVTTLLCHQLLDLGYFNLREFRNDIEGIRAIGAILVMVYHIWSQRVSGGVDVFFVVSAFLMTDMLLRSREQAGRLEITRFYSKILARITPLALWLFLQR